MKRPLRPSRCLLLPTFLAVLPALGQGTLQNLDFEAATVQQTQASGNVSSTDAFPGWTVYYDTNQQTQVGFNGECFGSTCIWLLGTNGSFASSLKSIEGGFSALLQGGVSGSGPRPHTTAAPIPQT